MADYLDPLPSSKSKYWEHADINKHILNDTPKCEHNFVRTVGVDVLCKKCNIGYTLSPGWEVKKGHIYAHGTLVI